MIGSSGVMQRLRRQLQRVAATSETVLVTGENGTGKEIVARTLHAMSGRNDNPWVTLNCPALSAQLLESELFGHKKGAFTGADQDRIGRFESADGGTLLLDEISEINLFLQSKLLRVLQERSFERVGSSETVTVDVRVIATTNRDLAAEIATGRFREDLYYRLAVLPIEVPPLRARREDIPELVMHFSGKAADRLHQEPSQFDDGTINMLCEYHWPGNVRQLENLVTRAVIFCDGPKVRADELRHWLFEHSGMTPSKDNSKNRMTNTLISTQHFESRQLVNSPTRLISGTYSPERHVVTLMEEPVTMQSAGFPFVGMTLDDLECQLIRMTLEHFNGHRAKTAEMLGIGLRTLTTKIAKMKDHS